MRLVMTAPKLTGMKLTPVLPGGYEPQTVLQTIKRHLLQLLVNWQVGEEVVVPDVEDPVDPVDPVGPVDLAAASLPQRLRQILAGVNIHVRQHLHLAAVLLHPQCAGELLRHRWNQTIEDVSKTSAALPTAPSAEERQVQVCRAQTPGAGAPTMGTMATPTGHR